MDNPKKDWLVRTRTGEILGPFSERELLEGLKQRTFSFDDEIAPSEGEWISGQALTNRDADELTATHTRTHQTNTKSLPTNSESALAEDLTPTPQILPRTAQEIFDQRRLLLEKRHSTSPPRTGHRTSRIGSLSAVVCVMAGFWLIVSNFAPKAGHGHKGLSHVDGEATSPYLRQIYESIRSGDRQNALQSLAEFHDKPASKNDLEHLIPYAALLITESNASLRARALLEPILSSTQASTLLKAQAHLWLGYLLLNDEQGDMGESHFLECLQLDPKNAAARFNLGRAYLKQEKFSQALEYLQLAELEVPDLWLVHLYKGRAKAALGNNPEAQASYVMAIQSAPDRWISYIYYSLFLMSIHQNEQAQTYMKKMLTRDPDYEVKSPTEWGYFQEKVNYAHYLNPFSDVMEHYSGEEKELGKVYLRYLMRPAGSEPEEKRIEAMAEKGGTMAKVLALKMVLDQDGSQAADIKTALDRLPEDLSDFGYFAYVLRGDAKSRLGDINGAQTDFQHALTMDPRSAISHWAYAVFLKKTQRTEDAESEIKNLLSYHPNYIPAVVSSHQF